MQFCYKGVFDLETGSSDDRIVRRKQTSLPEVFEDISKHGGFTMLQRLHMKYCKERYQAEQTSSYLTRICSTNSASVIPVIDTYHIDVWKLCPCALTI